MLLHEYLKSIADRAHFWKARIMTMLALVLLNKSTRLFPTYFYLLSLCERSLRGALSQSERRQLWTSEALRSFFNANADAQARN